MDRPERGANPSELDGRRFRILAETSLDRIAEIDRSGRILYASPNHTTLAGLDPETVADHGSIDFVHEEDAASVTEMFRRLFVAREPARASYRARSPGGEWRWFETLATPFELSDGEPRALLVSRDITEARQAKERLAESERRLRLMADSAYDVIAVYGGDGALLYANRRSTEVFGWTADQTARTAPQDLVHPADRERVTREMGEAFAGKGNGSLLLSYRVKRADGSWAWIESNSSAYETETGERRIVVVARDVSEREEAAARVRESEARYRNLVENASEAIVVVEEGVLRYVNAAAIELFGATGSEQLVGRIAAEFVEPMNDEVAFDATDCERVAVSSDLGEVRLRRLDGALRTVMASGTITEYRGAPAFQAVLHDVTALRDGERERQRLSDQLQESRRLESLGVLAGGVAHDFNNLLQVILANARMTQRAVAGQEPLEAMLADVVEAGESAARLTRQLLAYAGRGEPDVRPVGLGAHVQSLTALLEAAAPKKVVLRYEIAEPAPAVLADVVQLEQVTMNLVRNAAEALGDRAGEVVVRTGAREVDASETEGWLGADDLRPGVYAFLEVRDEGVGMDAATQQRIFDPFFTTKPQGHGLGLSAVLGLVRAHGGGLALDSAPGTGTTFRVYLPLAEDEPVESEPLSVPVEPRSATVLIVDDEPGIRRLARRILQDSGCEVIEAADGDEALEVFFAHSDAVDLVLLDLSMPKRSGLEVLRELRLARADLPILLASGYDAAGTRHALEEQELTAFIEKPYREERLLERVQVLLGKANG